MAARRTKSGKRSAASSKRRRKQPLTYFIDECLGGGILGQALRAAGAHAIIGRERFAPGTQDQDWLPVAGDERWIVLTKDRHIRKRELELTALVNARVRAVVLASADLTGQQQAAVFVRALPKIDRICRPSRGPLIAVLSASGHISLIPVKRRRRLKALDA
jgi:hypothetical protein